MNQSLQLTVSTSTANSALWSHMVPSYMATPCQLLLSVQFRHESGPRKNYLKPTGWRKSGLKATMARGGRVWEGGVLHPHKKFFDPEGINHANLGPKECSPRQLVQYICSSISHLFWDSRNSRERKDTQTQSCWKIKGVQVQMVFPGWAILHRNPKNTVLPAWRSIQSQFQPLFTDL